MGVCMCLKGGRLKQGNAGVSVCLREEGDRIRGMQVSADAYACLFIVGAERQ